MISTSKKFIFIHIPKTAGNSITDVLSEYSDNLVVVRPSKVGKRQGRALAGDPGLKHAPALEIKKRIGTKDFYSFHKFCVVRNPWDRLISFVFWENAERGPGKPLTTVDFKRKIYPPQTKFICDNHGKLLMNTVLRFEHLERDMGELCRHLDIPFAGLTVVNKSAHSGYRRYFNKDLRDWVAKHYAKDIEMFGYEF